MTAQMKARDIIPGWPRGKKAINISRLVRVVTLQRFVRMEMVRMYSETLDNHVLYGMGSTPGQITPRQPFWKGVM